MQIANISEAKAQLSALIEKAMAGEEVIIGKAGKPVARLVKYENNRTLSLGIIFISFHCCSAYLFNALVFP